MEAWIKKQCVCLFSRERGRERARERERKDGIGGWQLVSTLIWSNFPFLGMVQGICVVARSGPICSSDITIYISTAFNPHYADLLWDTLGFEKIIVCHTEKREFFLGISTLFFSVTEEILILIIAICHPLAIFCVCSIYVTQHVSLSTYGLYS